MALTSARVVYFPVVHEVKRDLELLLRKARAAGQRDPVAGDPGRGGIEVAGAKHVAEDGDDVDIFLATAIV